jgi:hypothetical protein
VKGTTVSLCLRIYLCALTNTNKLSSAVAGEMVAELATNLAYPCIILFYLFGLSFLFFSIMNSTPISQFAKPTSASSKPPESLEPILTPGYELCPCFINMIQEQSFLGEGDANPYSHLREFEQTYACLRITGILDNTLR